VVAACWTSTTWPWTGQSRARCGGEIDGRSPVDRAGHETVGGLRRRRNPAAPGRRPRTMTRLVAARANLAAGLRGGQELLLWSSTAAPARRTQRANVLLAVPGLLEQIEGRIDANPLRQERTPGFDLAVVAATVARTPDTPSPAANGLRRVGRFVSDHRRDLLLGVDGWRAGPGAADDCHRGAVGVVAVVFRHGSARHDARRGSAGSWMFCARGGGYPPAHAGLEYGQQWRGSVRSVDRDYDRWCVGPGRGHVCRAGGRRSRAQPGVRAARRPGRRDGPGSAALCVGVAAGPPVPRLVGRRRTG
jgi:hypothetical protein